MDIHVDNLTDPQVIALLREHLQAMTLHLPPESIHALDLDALRAPQITFWTAWRDEALLGCGALKAIDATHGEIKSMRTSSAHLRSGVASALLRHAIAEARIRGYRRRSLETGSAAAFAPARAMYARYGFVDCGPFDGYVEDPYSVFMTLAL